MKIREKHSIWDRIQLLVILVLLLVVVWILGTRMSGLKAASTQRATIQVFLETALEPIGTTMYIWGGGWDDGDSESGATSTQIGLSPQWELFAKEQEASYDYTQHRYERENGLDCSGFVGWVVYNAFETESGQAGYVTLSTEMAEGFANRGWGRLIHNPKKFLPGDIVSMEGHVWICLGTCADGSVLLVHSSPPGVSVCGTQLPQKNQGADYDGSSIAITLATEFMTAYYPDWQEKYSNRTASSTYLENVSVMRWNPTTMSDAKEMQAMSGEEVLQMLEQSLSNSEENN